MVHNAFIGLGSNLDNPIQQVSEALEELGQLPRTELMRHSRLYRSDPVGPEGQPDYINAVALIRTELEPLALLDALQNIEAAHQRRRTQRWGPRTLDLDLLLYSNEVIATERLTVPHPFMAQREFVLYPLAEIEPQLRMPDGTSLQALLNKCPVGTLVPVPVY